MLSEKEEQETPFLDGSRSGSSFEEEADIVRQGRVSKGNHNAKRSRCSNIGISSLLHGFLILGYTLVAWAVIMKTKAKTFAGPELVYCTSYLSYLLM
jgi:hypothetical protein